MRFSGARLLFLIFFVENVSCKGYFAITGSRIINYNSKYRVSVTSQGYEKPQTLEVAIRVSDLFDKNNNEILKTIRLNNGVSQSLEFDLTSQRVGKYHLRAKCLSGENFEQIVELELSTKKNIVIVQTDKAIYKPADKVQFRVLVLDSELRSSEPKKVKVFIADGAENKIKQFDDVQLIKGVFQNELQLSESTVLGNWSIVVKVDNQSETIKSFEVAEYVEPRFEITIIANRHTNYVDGRINVTGQVKYALDQIVHGSVLVTAKVQGDGNRYEQDFKKSCAIDEHGKFSVDFNIKKDFQIKLKWDRAVHLVAEFQEAFTGQTRTAEANVIIHQHPYKLELLKSSDGYKTGLPFTLTAIVTHPGSSKQNVVKFELVYYYDVFEPCFEKGNRCRFEKFNIATKEAPIVDGISKLDLSIANNSTRISVTAKYLQVEKSVSVVRLESESNQFLQIRVATANPVIDKRVKIDVTATEKLTQVTYQILAKGSIIISDTISVENKQQFSFEFNPTFAMVPTANIVVFYIRKDGEIISDATKIEMKNEMRNHINIELSKIESMPGEDIDITINADQNSLIGIMVVDQNALTNIGENNIEELTIFEELSGFNVNNNEISFLKNPNSTEKVYSDFQASNAVVLTNAKNEYERLIMTEDNKNNLSNSKNVKHAVFIQPDVRKAFTNTWIFDTYDFDETNSKITIPWKVPDLITSWIVTGFAVNPTTGLGVVKNPLKLKVFKPFYVTMNLPEAIKRGEIVSIPITIFNYMADDQKAEVTLYNNHKEFEFADVTEGAIDVRKKKIILVKSQTGKLVSFIIRPLKVGRISIKVIVLSPEAGDGAERQLTVEPEGITHYMNEAVLIDLRNESEFKGNINLKIPSNVVPDSLIIEASASGDVLGLSIESFDNLLKVTTGSDDQNMLKFASSIVMLDFLKSLRMLTSEVETKATKILETGFQTLLTHKHENGSFSFFGKDDRSGSTWFTAFIAKSLHQASKFISIDLEIVDQALSFLNKTQARDGSFPEVGQIINSNMQGGSSKGIALTAYTLITFMENDSRPGKYQSTIDKALNFINKNVFSIEDNYSLAIAAYAMQLAKHDVKHSMLEELNENSVNENGMKHWRNEEKTNQESSANIEMTAYALQAFIEAGRNADAIQIVKWLVAQRNENGGFKSTEDTVVSMEALAKFALKVQRNKRKVNITLKDGNKIDTVIKIDDANALTLQKHEMISNSKRIEIEAKGEGLSILQIAYKYNLNAVPEEPRFLIKQETHKNSTKNFLQLKFCTSFVPKGVEDKSNLAVMELSLPSGFTFESESLEDFKAVENVKKVELKDTKSIVVYFANLTSTKICFNLNSIRLHNVANQKSAHVTVYEYKDDSRRGTIFYNFSAISLCDICSGSDDCTRKCERSSKNVFQVFYDCIKSWFM